MQITQYATINLNKHNQQTINKQAQNEHKHTNTYQNLPNN